MKSSVAHGFRAARFAMIFGVLGAASLGSDARAALVLQIQNATATAGQSGSFDVRVTAGTGTSYQVGGFTVQLSAAPGLTLTGVQGATNYIFGTPDLILTGVTPTSFAASDGMLAAPGYVPVTSSTVLGLLHVTFVASAPGTYSITSGALTGFFDVNGDPLPLATVTPGTITVSAGAVPEPASLITLATAVVTTGFVLTGRRRFGRRRD